LVLIQPETKARTVVPVHPGLTIKEPLLRAILCDANLSVESLSSSCDRLEREGGVGLTD
jgi:hypothetical protein